MSYTNAQRSALRWPCRLAVCTMRAGLRHQLSPALSLVLSINTGYE